MRTLLRTGRVAVVVAGLMVATGQTAWGQAQEPEWLASLKLLPSNAVPHGNFFFANNFGVISRSSDFISSFGPPFPGIPPADIGLPIYQFGDSTNFIIDDTAIAESAQAMAYAGGSLRGVGLALDDAAQLTPMQDLSSSTNLWLGITGVSAGNVYLTLQNAVAGDVYAVETKSDLLQSNSVARGQFDAAF